MRDNREYSTAYSEYRAAWAARYGYNTAALSTRARKQASVRLRKAIVALCAALKRSA